MRVISVYPAHHSANAYYPRRPDIWDWTPGESEVSGVRIHVTSGGFDVKVVGEATTTISKYGYKAEIKLTKKLTICNQQPTLGAAAELARLLRRELREAAEEAQAVAEQFLEDLERVEAEFDELAIEMLMRHELESQLRGYEPISVEVDVEAEEVGKSED